MDVRGWRKTAEDRHFWKLIQKEARVLHGPYNQCRKSVQKFNASVQKENNFFRKVPQ
jgi:hypothetical protein